MMEALRTLSQLELGGFATMTTAIEVEGLAALTFSSGSPFFFFVFHSEERPMAAMVVLDKDEDCFGCVSM
jgi:hypothetical protein